ncbi:MAG: hypothetical protein SGARI_000097, partial [Bacillariaceae sp.]
TMPEEDNFVVNTIEFAMKPADKTKKSKKDLVLLPHKRFSLVPAKRPNQIQYGEGIDGFMAVGNLRSFVPFFRTNKRLNVIKRYAHMKSVMKTVLETHHTDESLKKIFLAREEIVEGKYGAFSRVYKGFESLIRANVSLDTKQRNKPRKDYVRLAVTMHHYKDTKTELGHEKFTKAWMIEILSNWFIACYELFSQAPQISGPGEEDVVYHRTREFIRFYNDHVLPFYSAHKEKSTEYGDFRLARYGATGEKLGIKINGHPIKVVPREGTNTINDVTVNGEVISLGGNPKMKDYSKPWEFGYAVGMGILTSFFGSDMMETFFVQNTLKLEMTLLTKYKTNTGDGIPIYPAKYLDPVLHFMLELYWAVDNYKFGSYGDGTKWTEVQSKPPKPALAALVNELLKHKLVGPESQITKPPEIFPSGATVAANDGETLVSIPSCPELLVKSFASKRFVSNRQRLLLSQRMPTIMEGKPDGTVLSYVDKDAQDDDDPYMNVSILAELYETEFHTEQLPEEIQKEFNALVAKAYTTMRKNPSPENAGKLIKRCRKYLERDSETQEDLQILDADIGRLERWIASIVHPIDAPPESIDAPPKPIDFPPESIDAPPDNDREENLEDKTEYEQLHTPVSLGSRFASVRRESRRWRDALSKSQDGQQLPISRSVTATKIEEDEEEAVVVQFSIRDLQSTDAPNEGFGQITDDLVDGEPTLRALVSGYKYFIKELEGSSLQEFLVAGLDEVAKHLVRQQRRADGMSYQEAYRSKISPKSPEFLKQKSLIDEVPLPKTAKQMALAGCLLSMENFLLCKGAGKGALAHVFESIPLDASGRPDTSLKLALRTEIVRLLQFPNIFPTLIDGSLDHPGIAKPLGHFPITAHIDKTNLKANLKSTKTFAVFASLYELGTHTMWDAGFDLQDELRSAKLSLKQELESAKNDSSKQELKSAHLRNVVEKLHWVWKTGEHMFDTVDFMNREKGKLHRDLKPNNIISVDRADIPVTMRAPEKHKAIDFGMAKAKPKHFGFLSYQKGTEEFMPLTRGNRCLNHDVWSMMVCMFWLLLNDLIETAITVDYVEDFAELDVDSEEHASATQVAKVEYFNKLQEKW